MSDAIGAMRARVKLQSAQRVADEIGGAALLWTDEAEVWAQIEVLGAGERAEFDGAHGAASFRVSINRFPDVQSGWRLLWGGRVLRITGVIDGGGARMTLVCEEAPQ